MKSNFSIVLATSLFLFLISCKTGGTEKTNTTPEENSSLEQPIDSTVVQPVITKKIINYDSTLWSDLSNINSSIIIDMRYATKDNFVKEKMYECSRCFLRPEVARAISNIQTILESKGLGLKMLDCYRPRPIQWKLWNKVPDPRYVADPKKGSMHNRGVAVDLTLVDQKGNALDMGTPYDFFGPEAYTDYKELPDTILQRRRLLQDVMVKNGFKTISTEWWHFSWTGKSHPLSDMLWVCE